MTFGVIRRPTTDSWQALRRLNSVLDEAFTSWPFAQEGNALTAAWLPPVDVFEDKDSVRIVAELPGVKAEDVKIQLENNVLTLRGEKRQSAEEKTERVRRYERSYGTFERSFSLPTTVDPDRIEASYEQGILTVTLPKVEKARPRQIEVKAK